MSSSSLRVLHISTWNIPCGIASYCADLITALDATGISSEVFPLQPHEWRSYLPGDAGRLFGEIRRRAPDFDLVHIQHEHNLFGHACGPTYAMERYAELLDELHSAGRPVVTTFHTEPAVGLLRGIRLVRKVKAHLRRWQWRRRVGAHFGVASGAARAIVHTHPTRFVLARFGIRSDAIHVLPHACPAPREPGLMRQAARASLGLSPETCLLTIFGFVESYKGHDLAVRALKHLPSEYRLAIVGGRHPESRDTFLNRLLRNLDDHLRSRVTITGYVDKATADRYFAATDLCLAPYRPFANLSASGAITWALSSGRPTIASKIDAFQAVQRDGECLFLVTPDAVRELAWAIQTLHHTPALQERLVANARAYCLRHSWTETARATLEIYERTLGRSVRVLPGVAQRMAA